MAEGKSGSNCNSSPGSAGHFAKRVQRSLSRAQEKMLQKLGKSVETRDEHFDLCVQNLSKQQSDGHRLYKDIKLYYNSVKAMREASKRLSQTLLDVYESDWEGDEDLPAIVEGEDLLWSDYEEKLGDQTVRTMDTYMSQFPDIKERVAKRGRKLVDYDSSRHHLEMLQNAKKKDEAKIAKAEEEFSLAQSVFEDLNTELRQELPVLYQSRIGCYVTIFENLSNLRDVFYKEMTTLNSDLFGMMKTLETQHSDKVFIIKGLQRSNSKTSRKRRSFRISSPVSCNTTLPAFDQGASPVRAQKARSSTNSSTREGLEAEPTAGEEVESPQTLPTEEPAPAPEAAEGISAERSEEEDREDDPTSDQNSIQDGPVTSLSTEPSLQASESHAVNTSQEDLPASLAAPSDPQPNGEEAGKAAEATDLPQDGSDADGGGLKAEVPEQTTELHIKEEPETVTTGAEESPQVQAGGHQDDQSGDVPGGQEEEVKGQ
ncbi:hypothetical protein AGOR_G00079280 [Albula goreensis]|uniref:BAR domain-containing protein n=1 Tax=Albula goreensis TaxID=1534307 RepID=A0A8T3DRZ9_9TELE|nr:hypothetical protein AGOR_G00079280 [Albula goreensis]